VKIGIYLGGVGNNSGKEATFYARKKTWIVSDAAVRTSDVATVSDATPFGL